MTRTEVLSRGFAARPSAEDALACGRPNPLNRGTGPYIGKKRNGARASRFFRTFLCRRCTTTTWNYLISRFVEDTNTSQRLSFSFPELWYSPLKFNSRKICQHLTNWTRWNMRDKVWSSMKSLFKWRFGSRHCCCLSSLFTYRSTLWTRGSFWSSLSLWSLSALLSLHTLLSSCTLKPQQQQITLKS